MKLHSFFLSSIALSVCSLIAEPAISTTKVEQRDIIVRIQNHDRIRHSTKLMNESAVMYSNAYLDTQHNEFKRKLWQMIYVGSGLAALLYANIDIKEGDGNSDNWEAPLLYSIKNHSVTEQQHAAKALHLIYQSNVLTDADPIKAGEFLTLHMESKLALMVFNQKRNLLCKRLDPFPFSQKTYCNS